jgi:hypothetical protein
VPVSAAALPASSAKSGHTKLKRAPESSKKYWISPALRSGFIGTTTPPARSVP